MLFNIIFTRFERQFIIAIHNKTFILQLFPIAHYCTSIQYVVRGFYAMHHDCPLACEIITRLPDFVTSICVRFYYLSHVYFEAQRKPITCRCLTNTEVGWSVRPRRCRCDRGHSLPQKQWKQQCEREREREREREIPVVCGVGSAGPAVWRLWLGCLSPPPSASAYVKEQHSRGKQELFIAQHCRALTGGGRHVCVRAAESKGVSRQCV